MNKTRHLFATAYDVGGYQWGILGGYMQQPISIAPLLWNNQTARTLDTTITHGKGRQGIIIRTRRAGRWIPAIKSVLRRGLK
jgi:hypothetical protein